MGEDNTVWASWLPWVLFFGEMRLRLSKRLSIITFSEPWWPATSDRLGRGPPSLVPGYPMGTSPASSSSGRKGEWRPLRVLASELARVRKVVQGSKSSLLWELGLPSHFGYWEPGLLEPPSNPPCIDIYRCKRRAMKTNCNTLLFRYILLYVILTPCLHWKWHNYGSSDQIELKPIRFSED